MVAIFDPNAAYPIWLEVQAPSDDPNTLMVTLTDAEGSTGSGVLHLDFGRRYRNEAGWGDFLASYLAQWPGMDQLAAFGGDLFRSLIFELPQVRDAWGKAASAAGRRPLALTIELGRHTESFAALPLELLRDDEGFVFARPGSSLCRTYQATSAARFSRPAVPRVLFVWACPPGSGHPFDPEPHATALTKVFGAGRVERLNHATVDGLRERLQQAADAKEPFHYLHLLAHGYRDDVTAGVCLCTADGGLDYVQAQVLAQAVAGWGVELAFLCSCQTAVGGGSAFSGVGQQLIARTGGDVPCVIATQANLPVRGSAELSERFYRQLNEGGDPAGALAQARREVFNTGGGAWSVPVLIARPERRHPARSVSAEQLAGLPGRRTTYLSRPGCEQEILTALRASRLVSLVGLTGIGKTELGKEGARQARAVGLCRRVVYREAHEGMDTRLLRKLLGAPLGLLEAVDDEQLALAFEGLKEEVLLVIDNADHMMRSDRDQAAFRSQIDTLLQHTTRLRILLTTRWPVKAKSEVERLVDVPPLTREETAELLTRELRAVASFQEVWPSTAAWVELIGLIDGHPLALCLVSRHLQPRGATLEQIRDRLSSLKPKAMLTSDLLGREDAFRTLQDDKQQRLRSLVAAKELSFDGQRLPWEERRQLGFFKALITTVKLIAHAPEDAFRRLRLDRDYFSPIAFIVIMTWVGMFFDLIWILIIDPAESSFFVLWNLVAGPILATAIKFIWAGILHLCLAMLPALQRSNFGFEGTFKVVSYAAVANLALAIPILSVFVTPVLTVFLLKIGIRETHKANGTRAFIAVLLLGLIMGCVTPSLSGTTMLMQSR